MVWPSICLLISQRESISSGRASPFTKRAITLFIQSTPATEQQEGPEALPPGRGTTLKGCRSLGRLITAQQPNPSLSGKLTLTAWGTLATTLMLVELNETSDGFHNVCLEDKKQCADTLAPHKTPSLGSSVLAHSLPLYWDLRL